MKLYNLEVVMLIAGLVAARAEPVIHTSQKVNQYAWVNEARDSNAPY